jgi:calcium binding protein 39
VNEDITRSIAAIKVGLCGDAEHDAAPEVIARIANEVYAQDVMALVVTHLGKLEFEVSFPPAGRFVGIQADWQARKDVGTVYGALLRRTISDRSPTVEHLSSRPDILFSALKGYVGSEVHIVWTTEADRAGIEIQKSL